MIGDDIKPVKFVLAALIICMMVLVPFSSSGDSDALVEKEKGLYFVSDDDMFPLIYDMIWEGTQYDVLDNLEIDRDCINISDYSLDLENYMSAASCSYNEDTLKSMQIRLTRYDFDMILEIDEAFEVPFTNLTGEASTELQNYLGINEFQEGSTLRIYGELVYLYEISNSVIMMDVGESICIPSRMIIKNSAWLMGFVAFEYVPDETIEGKTYLVEFDRSYMVAATVTHDYGDISSIDESASEIFYNTITSSEIYYDLYVDITIDGTAYKDSVEESTILPESIENGMSLTALPRDIDIVEIVPLTWESVFDGTELSNDDLSEIIDYIGTTDYDFTSFRDCLINELDEPLDIPVKMIKEKFKIIFDVNGGDELSESERTKTVEVDGPFGSLPVPTREGYKFTGWYTDANGGTKISHSDTADIDSDLTLYAHWSIIVLDTGETFWIGDYEYEVISKEDCTVKLITYNGDDKNVIVPQSVVNNAEYIIEEIEQNVFYNRDIESVILSDSLKTIGNSVFWGCEKLVSVTIGNAVEVIEEYAFHECLSLESITIPNSVKSIGDGAFRYCEGLTSVIIGNSVQTIGYSAFNHCLSLKSITIPNSVKSIGDYAFEDCKKLTSVTIGNAVQSIGDDAFGSCESLESIVIPGSVESIGDDAFRNCDALSTITFEEGIRAIGENALRGCPKIESLYLPKTVESIGDRAFSCYGLSKIVVHDDNPYFTSVDGVLYDEGFTTLVAYPCIRYADLILPDTVTSMSSGVLSFSITESIYIGPNYLENLEYELFDCQNLRSVIVSDENPNYKSIDGVLFSKDGSILYYCPPMIEMTSYTVPDSVETIFMGAFALVNDLTEVILNNGLTTIQPMSFWAMSNLKSITIPSTVETIGEDAFSFCFKLEEILLDGDVDGYTSINGVFYKTNDVGEPVHLLVYPCSKQDKIYIMPDTVMSADQSAFSYLQYVEVIYFSDIEWDHEILCCTNLKEVHIPAGMTFEHRQMYVSDCRNLVNIFVDDENEFYIDIDGMLISKNGDLIICPEGKGKEITIPNGVESVDSYDPFHYNTNLQIIHLGSLIVDDLCVGENCQEVEFYTDESMTQKATILTGTLYVKQIPRDFVLTLILAGGTLPDGIDNTIEYTYGTNPTLPIPTRDGYTFRGWYTEGLSYEKLLGMYGALRGDGLLFASWVEIPPTSITLDSNGGELPQGVSNTIFAEEGEAIGDLPVPTRMGYTFNGWFSEKVGGTQIIASWKVSSDDTIYAQWTVNQYTITFDTDGGSSIDNITQDFGTVIVTPMDPIKIGYTFAGWNTIVPSTMPAEDMTIEAKWTINQYTITFDTNGGSTISAITQAYGTAISKPVDPTMEGHTFVGWNKEVPSTMPAEDMIVKALWEVNSYDIRFSVNGIVVFTIELDFGETIELPDIDTPTRESTEYYDYEFKGWKGHKDHMRVKSDHTFEADFKANLKKVDAPKSDGKVDIGVDDSDEISIPSNIIEDIKNDASEGTVVSVEITLPLGSIGIDSGAISNMNDGDNSIAMKEVDAKDVGKHSEVVEGRPVIDVSVGDKHDFDGGKLVIRINYNLRTNEVATGLEVWHFDNNGDYVKESCYYDSETKQIVFTVDTLSKFAIMYQEPVDDSPDDKDNDGNGMFFYIGIGVAAAIVIAGLAFFLIRRRA